MPPASESEIRDLPLPPTAHALRMDAAAWAGPLLMVEPDAYAAQIALKEETLAADPAYHFSCPPAALPAAWEALGLLLPSAARDWPAFFRLDRDGPVWLWTNRLLGTATAFVPGGPDAPAEGLTGGPLGWLGRQFQEDFVLMTPDATGSLVCAAGTLCFASGWCLGDKLGLPLAGIHAPVPGFADGPGPASGRLLERLKPGRPVGRWNWTFAPTDRLNLAPRLAHEWEDTGRSVTPENAPTRCFLRTERQTLSRLPRTQAVLFTIHTYLTPISRLARDPEARRRLCAHLESLPPDLRAYRGMDTYADALLASLQDYVFED